MQIIGLASHRFRNAQKKGDMQTTWRQRTSADAGLRVYGEMSDINIKDCQVTDLVVADLVFVGHEKPAKNARKYHEGTADFGHPPPHTNTLTTKFMHFQQNPRTCKNKIGFPPPSLRESETTIKIKFALFGGVGKGAREENCPKCFF